MRQHVSRILDALDFFDFGRIAVDQIVTASKLAIAACT